MKYVMFDNKKDDSVSWHTAKEAPGVYEISEHRIQHPYDYYLIVSAVSSGVPSPAVLRLPAEAGREAGIFSVDEFNKDTWHNARYTLTNKKLTVELE